MVFKPTISNHVMSFTDSGWQRTKSYEMLIESHMNVNSLTVPNKAVRFTYRSSLWLGWTTKVLLWIMQ